MAELEIQQPQNPGAESLVFKPAKVSWVINAYLLKQTNRSLKWFVYLVLAVCVGFVAWAYLTEKAIVVDAPGEIVSKAPPIPVTSKVAMTVREIQVKNHQRVKRDDVLVVSTRDLSIEEQSAIQSTVETVRQNVALEKSDRCANDCEAKIRFLAEQGVSRASRLDPASELSHALMDLNRYLKDYIAQISNWRELPSTTASLRHEIEIVRQQLSEIKKRRAEKILAVEYQQLLSRQVQAESQLNEKTLSARSGVQTARNAVELGLDGIGPSLKSYSSDSVIRSPAEGAIQFAELKGEGQIVGPGQLLLYVTSATQELGVKFKVPGSEISKVKKGQDAKLDLTSYPASEYGVQEAVLTDIPEKLVPEGKEDDGSFEVYGDLKHQGVVSHAQLLPLRAGMALSAKIIIRHERLLLFISKKIFSIKDQWVGGP